jgi:hypothetical protein
MRRWAYESTMAAQSRSPPPQFASRGANPTLETIEYVRHILKTSDQPVSRNKILRVLSDWGHSTNRGSVNAVIQFLGADGNVAEGSKGLIWVPDASPALAREIDARRRL